MSDKEWLKNTLAKCQEYGYRTIPVRNNKPLVVWKNTEVNVGDFAEYAKADMVGVILDDVVLVDYDGNKPAATGQIMRVEELEERLDLDLIGMPRPFQVNAEGDSIHWLFRLPDNIDVSELGNKVDKREFPFIDIQRGQTLVFLKSHKASNILPRGELEICPDVLIEAFKKDRESRKTDEQLDDDMGLMAVVMQNEKPDLTDDEVRFYLQNLPAGYGDNRDNWLRVGMALSHQYSDDLERGWLLFDEWSKTAEGYDEEDNRASWDSFDNEGSGRLTTFASVIKNAGGKITKDEYALRQLVADIDTAEDMKQLNALYVRVADASLKPAQLDSLISKLCKSFEMITGVKTSKPAMAKEIRAAKTDTRRGDFVDDYVFVTSTNKFVHRETKEDMVKDAFNMAHGAETPRDEEGRPMAAHQYAQDRIRVVHRSMYWPSVGEIFERDGVNYLNEYRSNPLVSVKPHSGIVERIQNHIAHLLSDEREREIFTYYLAHNAQHIGKKIPWCIVLQGVQGDGKSFFCSLMEGVLGIDNVNLLSTQTLEGSNFTKWAVGQCMTFIEEMKVSQDAKYDVINNMKPYITNEHIEVTKKNKDPVKMMNTTNYMAFTNFKGALPIDDNDRRYCVLASRWQTKEALEGFIRQNPDYYPDIYESMRAGIAEIKYWLENLEIPKWFYDTRRAPDTKAKKAMIMQSRPAAYYLVAEAIEDFHDVVFEDGDLNVSALQRQVSDGFLVEARYKDFPKTSQLNHILTDMGYEKVKRRRSKNDPSGNLQTFYTLGGGEAVNG